MSGVRVPLLAPRAAGPLAWRHGRPVSAARFVAAARALAAALPDGRPVNLCQDRLLFAVGLVAALLRGQASLLPPDALPATLRQAPAGDGEPYLLLDGDTPVPSAALRVHRVRWDDGGAGPTPEGREGSPPGHGTTAAADRDAVAAASVDGAAPALCLLTSGSTGAPQPHAKRWAALAVNIAAEAARLAEHLGRPSLAGLTVVATVPAQHSYGLESSVLLALLGGAAFDAGRPYYPADIAAALAAVPRPRALVTTPFHLKTLLRSGVALPAVDLVLSATAPLSPQLAQQAEAACGGVLVEIYGCTEAGQVASRRTTDGDTWTTLGELRLRAVRPGDAGSGTGTGMGTDRGAGTGTGAGAGAGAGTATGMGAGSSAGLSAGAGDGGAVDGDGVVFDDPLRSTVAGGHVETPTVLADLIERHDARRFRLLGRANDLIHVGGKRSSLGHLNFHLNRIDGVDDGAFWLPDDGDAPADGETVVRPLALVVAPRLTAAQVTAALRAVLEPVFVPRRVLHVDALPREATGKLTAATLQRVARQALAAAGGKAVGSAAVPAAPWDTGPDGATPARLPPAPAALPHTASAELPDAVPPQGAGLAAPAAVTAMAMPAAAAAAGSPADAAVVRQLRFDAAHPALAGHFPGHPVLPGTVLLAAVLDVVADEPVLRARLGAAPRVEQAKFLAPVVPAAAGTALRLTLRPDARGGVDAEVRFDDDGDDDGEGEGEGDGAGAGAGAGDTARPRAARAVVLRARFAPATAPGAVPA